jgi:hypothetical protein
MNLGIVEEQINLESIKGANPTDITNGWCNFYWR